MSQCQGLFELRGSSATDHIIIWDGYVFVYDSSLDPQDKTGGSALNTGSANELFSIIQVGDYAVYADFGGNTPYKWDNGDATHSKLIQSGTEFKFRYLAPFQRRIIGAYSDQTDGDIEIRWSNAWTTASFFASACEFAAANQLFKPGNDSITGIKTLGGNQCFLYGTDSCNSIDYYPDYTTPFSIRVMNNTQGFVSHFSIVEALGAHYGFNKNYGFCAYAGGTQFPLNGRPVSEDIESWIRDMNQNYHDLIVGTFIPRQNEICWTVPLEGSSSCNALLFYHVLDGTWRRKDFAVEFVDTWELNTTLVWDHATTRDMADLGYTTWSDAGSVTWGELFSARQWLVYANGDGDLWYDTDDENAGSDFDGYYQSPIMDFGRPNDKDLLLEIWFQIVEYGDFNLYVWHRAGATVSECEGSGWTVLDEVDCNNPDNAVTYLAELGRFHQIRFGTDEKNERFGVNSIEFKYAPQGRY